jgi:hypothetical protein
MANWVSLTAADGEPVGVNLDMAIHITGDSSGGTWIAFNDAEGPYKVRVQEKPADVFAQAKFQQIS